MSDNAHLLSSGLEKVGRNKRYIFWFWLLNLTLAEFGVAAFRNQAHAVLDHSLYSGGLVHGFDLSVFSEMLARPEFGPMMASTMPAFYFANVFAVFTILLLPGVFLGYASTYRLPRDEFFRACGRNLWRFIRLLTVAGIVMGVVAGVLFSIQNSLIDKAGQSTNEVLPFEVRMTGLLVIFLVMCVLRIWFDLAEVDVVLSDQNAVRKSLGAALGLTFRNLARLLTSYVVTTVVAGVILVAGIWVWRHWVPPDRWLRASVVGQVTLFLLLIPRFWQRGIAVVFWQHRIMEPMPVQSPAHESVATPSGVANGAPVAR